MMELLLERTQYGVGQGCFHVQRLALQGGPLSSHWMPDSPIGRPFDIVYDCGAAAGHTVGGTDPLDWAIGHYRPTKDKEPDSIDVVYLSHFQMDHINGLHKLRAGIGGKRAKQIKLLVVPHLSEDMALGVLAQQAMLGYGTDLVLLQQFADALGGVVRGEDVLGIPTVRVLPGRRDTNLDADDDTNGLRPDWGTQPALTPNDLPPPVEGMTLWDNPQTLTRIVSDDTAFNLAVVSKLTGGGGYCAEVVWQLKLWCWKQSAKLSSDIATNLKSIAGFPVSLFKGPLSIADAAWIVKNAALIQAEYEKALLAHKITYANDHNVVSLCLYSGPADSTTVNKVEQLAGTRYWPQVNKVKTLAGWMGTGDALLGSKTVWSDFQMHYGKRIDEAKTVYVPHHGSGSKTPGNFNAGLFVNGPVAVMSAGAMNTYRHPASWVLSKLATQRAWPIVVTEMMRPGFTENFLINLS